MGPWGLLFSKLHKLTLRISFHCHRAISARSLQFRLTFKIPMASVAEMMPVIYLNYVLVLSGNSFSPTFLSPWNNGSPNQTVVKMGWLNQMLCLKGRWQTVIVTKLHRHHSLVRLPCPCLCFGTKSLQGCDWSGRRTRLRIVYEKHSGLAQVSVGQWSVH